MGHGPILGDRTLKSNMWFKKKQNLFLEKREKDFIFLLLIRVLKDQNKFSFLKKPLDKKRGFFFKENKGFLRQKKKRFS